MSSEFPQPLPCQVNTTIKIKQLLSVNEADETITIFVEYQSSWIDDRVGIRRSPENIEQNVTWFPQDNLNRVWTPNIYFLSEYVFIITWRTILGGAAIVSMFRVCMIKFLNIHIYILENVNKSL